MAIPSYVIYNKTNLLLTAILIFSLGSGCGFSVCRETDDLLKGELIKMCGIPEDLTGAVDVVPGLEEPGKIIVIHGSRCGKSNKDGRENSLCFEDEVELPSYVTDATVFLNGWDLQYLKGDRPVAGLGAVIGYPDGDIHIEGNKLKWKAVVVISDDNFDDGYRGCYLYTVIGWNRGAIDAVVEHDYEGNTNLAYSNDEPTALVSIPSYIQNRVFAGKKVAYLPRGFYFKWGDCDDHPHHHLLHIAYNMHHSEGFIAPGKFYQKLPEPSLPSPSDHNYVNVDEKSAFVSWETSGLFRDNAAKRDYMFGEVFSALGGNYLGIVQPAITVRPLNVGPVGAGVMRQDVVIENVPFGYAVPVLTDWHLSYPGNNEHVTRVGVWLDEISYARPSGGSFGTLSYSVFYVLRDENDKPDENFDHKVTVLGFQGVAPRPDLPDLIVDPRFPPVCKMEGGFPRITIQVKNQGGADAAGSSTRFEFLAATTPAWTGFYVPTPSIMAGGVVEVSRRIPPACFDVGQGTCSFKLTVDALSEVVESDETNNASQGSCGQP